tara:strand:+ start:153 stop:494 length:342 start_codon:yes stop_codon:yes gene_type:complete
MPIIETVIIQKKIIDKIKPKKYFLLLIKMKIKKGIKDMKIKKPLSKPQKKENTLIKLIDTKYIIFFVFKNFKIEIKKINTGRSLHHKTASFKMYKTLIEQNIKKYIFSFSSIT